MPEGLTLLRQRFASLFQRARRDHFYSHAAAIADKLLSNLVEVCVLHGDMHHENVLHGGDRGWLAIDPKGLWGERTSTRRMCCST